MRRYRSLPFMALGLLFILSIALAPKNAASRQDGAPEDEDAPESPVSPSESLDWFQLDDETTIDLVACEPTIIDPIAIRFDYQGRLWVVEMRDYPHGAEPGDETRSRIRILTDRDGDGFFEEGTTFAEDLAFATGIQPWRNGAIVTMAGEVAFFEDADQDGVADSRETWFTGFAEQNSQLRANHPTLSIDGQIYVANGLRGGTVVGTRSGDEPVSISGSDFSFDPHRRSYAPVSGGGQFGMAFDHANRRYICSNRNPCMQVVFENRYLSAYPSARIGVAKKDVAVSGFESRVYPISRFWTTSNLHAGQFTAACGVLLFHGDGLNQDFQGNVFVCEPTGNLVHREVRNNSGASFSSSSPYVEKEFLATQDEWFRPVNLETGPDGSLYVVDMYRAVIEHPDFVPAELKNRPDQRLGDDRGRIYRIRQADDAQRTLNDNIQGEHESILVSESATEREIQDRAYAWLDHPNGWQRINAFQWIFESPNERIDGERLQELATQGNHAASRIIALHLLRLSNQLTTSDLVLASRDSDVDVRVTAAQLAETLEPTNLVGDLLIELANDSEALVQFQVLLSTCQLRLEDGQREQVIRSVIRSARLDSWIEGALRLAAGEKHGEYASELVRVAREHSRVEPQESVEPIVQFLRYSAQQSAAGAANILQTLIGIQADELDHSMLQLLGALDSVRTGWLVQAIESLNEPQTVIFANYVERLDQVVRSTDSDIPTRLAALRLLTQMRQIPAEQLSEFAWGAHHPELRRIAFRGLAAQGDESFWLKSLERYPNETPAIRSEIETLMVGNVDRITILLDAIESGALKSNELDVTVKDRLKRIGDATLRERAIQVLASQIDTNRQRLIQNYQTSLELAGTELRGRALFEEHCSNCHRIGQLGTDVAPDISDSRIRSKSQLLTDILNPNQAIDAGYISYIIQTIDGRVLTGVIHDESATSITIRQAGGIEETLLRDEIEEMISTRQSLMPEGFEEQLDHQSMADLISFIKNWRYLDGRTPAEGFER